MDFRFIHAADIHLDSPLRGLDRYEGAPVEEVRGATRKAFRNLVDLALEEEVDFVIIAGDLYDGDWRDYNTGLFFASQVSRLQEADVRVFLIRGNHDAASQITRQLRLPANVKDFSTREPETVVVEELGAAIHGQGFAVPAVKEDLSLAYPEPLKDFFNIGLLHTCATGREGHENYAPCKTSYLAGKGYDYWGLGHVHQREILGEDPWIVFPGNIQGRHVRETGAKGCTLVEVRGGRVEAVEHRPLDILRWRICEVDADGVQAPDEVLERAERALEESLHGIEDRLLALRFRVRGSCPAHGRLVNELPRLGNDLRVLAAERGGGSLWVQKVELHTRPSGRPEEVLDSHPVASLLQYIREIARDEETLQDLLSELERDLNALPPEIFGEEELGRDGLELARKFLPEAEELILSRLFKKEEFSGEA